MKAIRYSWFVFFNCCCIIKFNSKPGEMGLQEFIIKLVANVELDVVFFFVFVYAFVALAVLDLNVFVQNSFCLSSCFLYFLERTRNL